MESKAETEALPLAVTRLYSDDTQQALVAMADV
jgi:hypothetical protein